MAHHVQWRNVTADHTAAHAAAKREETEGKRQVIALAPLRVPANLTCGSRPGWSGGTLCGKPEAMMST